MAECQSMPPGGTKSAPGGCGGKAWGAFLEISKMKPILLATAFLIASFTVASADSMRMDDMHMHDMHHHHHGCMTVKKVVHVHGHTISKVEKTCH
jgi:hypothetical protein